MQMQQPKDTVRCLDICFGPYYFHALGVEIVHKNTRVFKDIAYFLLRQKTVHCFDVESSSWGNVCQLGYERYLICR